MSFEMSRKHYAEMYGPTTGDAIRLADTKLLLEIEFDHTNYGDEVVFGGGKVIRDGMGQNGQMTRDQDIPDTVITNVVVFDYTGIYKADVALRDGHIFRIGKAGNPDITDGVNITIGASTDVIAGEHKILTAGAIDTHVHFVSPDQVPVALASGVTTMIGGGAGPRMPPRPPPSPPAPGILHGCCRPWKTCRSTWGCSARDTPAREARWPSRPGPAPSG